MYPRDMEQPLNGANVNVRHHKATRCWRSSGNVFFWIEVGQPSARLAPRPDENSIGGRIQGQAIHLNRVRLRLEIGRNDDGSKTSVGGRVGVFWAPQCVRVLAQHLASRRATPPARVTFGQIDAGENQHRTTQGMTTGALAQKSNRQENHYRHLQIVDGSDARGVHVS